MNTIINLLKYRKLGDIGKFSNQEDIINYLGEPDEIVEAFYDKSDAKALLYGNLTIYVTYTKKKILCIDFLNDNEYFRLIKRIVNYNNKNLNLKKITIDFKNFKKLSMSEIIQFLLKNEIEIEENEVWDEFYNFVYFPKNNKYFTIKNPKFKLKFTKEDQKIRSISIDYNYRSKLDW